MGGADGAFAVLPARTPGLANIAVVVLGEISFSRTRGWADQPFDLTISCAGASSVACTADGSDPLTPSTVLAAHGVPPLSLTVDPADLYNESRAWPAPAVNIRCVGIADGAPPSGPASHTYIFSEAVLDQGEFLEGDFAAGIFWSTAVDNSSSFLSAEAATRADMLEALVCWVALSNPSSTRTLLASFSRSNLALTQVSLPSISIAMPHEHLFGPEGIHRGAKLETEDYEFECSLELMYPPTPQWAGFAGTQSGAGIRIQGGGGRWQQGAYDHKQSFGLRFRSAYGASKLQYPVFESAPLHASSAADEFDKLILRAGHNKNWGATWDPENTVFTRDQFTRDLQIAMSGHGVHGTFVLLYLNGQFWGLYNLVERPDDAFQATYFGGDEQDYFSGKHKGGTIQGDPETYNSFERSAGSWNYATLAATLDVANYVDQAMLAAYAAIGDYPQYYYGLRLNPAPGLIRFFVWDAEDSWGGGSVRTGSSPYKREWSSDDPQLSRLDRTVAFWSVWAGTASFRQVWTDRAYRHLATPDGALTSASLRHKWAVLNDAIYPAMLLESARWGDERRTPGYTRNGTWSPARSRMDVALTGRAQKMVEALQLRNEAGQAMFATAAPPLARWFDGGAVSRDGDTHTAPVGVASLNLTASSLSEDGAAAPSTVVHYTTDGSDPRQPSGEAAASSTSCVLECVVRLPLEVTTLMARSRDEQGHWSPPLLLTIRVPAHVLINEVADKGNDADAACAGSDWLELLNPFDSSLSLAGLVLSDDHGLPYEKALALGGSGCPASLGAGELLLLCQGGAAHLGGVSYDGCGFEFKIGGSDEVGLYKDSSSEGGGDPQLVDVAAGCCSGDESTSYGRPLGGADGAFAVLPARTPGAPNSRAATPPALPSASPPPPTVHYGGPWPLHASDRLLRTADSAPFWWSSDTHWPLLWEYTLSEAMQIVDDRRALGFTAIALSVITFAETHHNVYGHHTFDNVSTLQPNAAYFAHADQVMDAMAARGMAVYLVPLWWNQIRGDYTR